MSIQRVFWVSFESEIPGEKEHGDRISEMGVYKRIQYVTILTQKTRTRLIVTFAATFAIADAAPFAQI